MNVLLRFLTYLFLMAKFSRGSTNLTGFRRFLLACKILFIRFNCKASASSFGEQLVLLNHVLDLPKGGEGMIAEFGCYKGGASIVLSIGAKIVGRKLIIFDSFEGLPTPSESISNFHNRTPLNYLAGMYAAPLEEVQFNIKKYGEIECCEFVKGYFNETLGLRPNDEKYALIFEDADLTSSVREVLKYSWPRLEKSSYYFCHEARDVEVCAIFFDIIFWETEIKAKIPGLIGVGFGLPTDPLLFEDDSLLPMLSRAGSCLAYTQKN